MSKHKHLFKKIFEEVIERSEKDALESMFGSLPPLPKGEEWGMTKELRTIFECSCGEKQTFIDEPDGEWNKSLGEEFTIK